MVQLDWLVGLVILEEDKRFYLRLLLFKHGDLPPEYLYEVNKNFTEPEADREVQHAISQSYKYDLKYLVDNYAKYTENLCGWPLPLDETLMNRIDTPGNEKIKKQYVAPEKASAVMGFTKGLFIANLKICFGISIPGLNIKRSH